MLIFRALVFFLLASSALCFAFYLGTGKPGYKRWGWVVLKWTVVAALAFFAVVLLGRIA